MLILYFPSKNILILYFTCLYYHVFCLKCGEEAHTPVDFETIAR